MSDDQINDLEADSDDITGGQVYASREEGLAASNGRAFFYRPASQGGMPSRSSGRTRNRSFVLRNFRSPRTGFRRFSR